MALKYDSARFVRSFGKASELPEPTTPAQIERMREFANACRNAQKRIERERETFCERLLSPFLVSISIVYQILREALVQLAGFFLRRQVFRPQR